MFCRGALPSALGACATNEYNKNNAGNTSYSSLSFLPSFQDRPGFNYTGQSQDQNGFNYPNVQNGFTNTSGYVNYNDGGDIFGSNTLADTPDYTTPEQLNLLRLAAQQIAGAQFTGPNDVKYNEDKFFNFFDQSQRPDSNIYPIGNNYSQPNTASNLDLSFNSNSVLDANYLMNSNNIQLYPKGPNQTSQNGSPNEVIPFMNQLNLLDQRPNDAMPPNNMPDYGRITQPMNYQNGDDEQMRNKMLPYNQNFPILPNGSIKPFNGIDSPHFAAEMKKRMGGKPNYPMGNQSFDHYQNIPVSNAMNYKHNGYQQNDAFSRDMNMMPRDVYQNSPAINDITNFDSTRDMQGNMMRQNDIQRQMNFMMHNRPPPNPLNVDVSFMHENAPFNLGKQLFLNSKAV